MFVCLVAIDFARATQPTYSGKVLTYWLLLNFDGDSSSQEAIRQIGTNGIPTLIELLSIKNKNVKMVLSKLQDKTLVYYYRHDEDPLDSQENLRKLAVNGFAILGTNGESAVPQLAKIFNEYDDETMLQAGRALSKVGPTGFFVLTNVINNTNAGVRDVAIRVIAKDGGGSPEVIRQLFINALQDPHSLIRLHAADFLRFTDPELVISALIPLLDVSNYGRSQNDIDKAFIYGQCSRAAGALAAYGTAAKSAAPKLLSVFTSVAVGTNMYLIKNLTGTLLASLRMIDSEIAKKAEDFILDGGPLGVLDYGWTDTLLPDGKELIAGGFFQTKVPIKTNLMPPSTALGPSYYAAQIPNKANHVFSRAQIFNPVTGNRTETAPMNVARYGHTAVLLANGKVLVAGGEDAKGHYLVSAELYDPATEKWIETGSMNAAHSGGDAVQQRNGKVLFDGEQYNPTTGKWMVITQK